MAYFDKNAPWKEFLNRIRFGIPALVHDISRLLVKLIENYIPTLKQSVDDILARSSYQPDESGTNIETPTTDGDDGHALLVHLPRNRKHRIYTLMTFAPPCFPSVPPSTENANPPLATQNDAQHQNLYQSKWI
ncbi:hypothetical protein ARMSODRAFT_1021585 [Armillaria solidipes]|uniref:Dynamin stalk domain-containing protein n=1 Tax=Armillaria solidipes TaxID=1076256 RepID=A0A2H3B1R4_9AGAR|nr:hypothetical protein ARMSODRAFT_1026959 [Armillaria solidipes]PBK66395.1 hypothetical protein ARMSODRAFT_1021585 [Armillaria solidipes]